MQTIGYIRVSTEEQAQSGLGLEAQERTLRAYCEAKGIALDDLLVDAGYSGKDLNRPGIAELLQRVREGQVATVMTVKIDRLSRRVIDTLNIVETLRQHDTAIVFVQEAIDTTTAAGKAMLTVIAAFAEMERNYLRRSREVHPDFHQLSAGSEQRASTELSALLNDAYATLRDPFRRAEYLLQLEGGPTAAEAKATAPEFLEEMLELRMEIEELRAAGERESPALAAMEEQLARRREALLGGVAERFGRLEGADTRQKKLVQIRELLNTARYIQGLLRDLRVD